MAGLGITGGFGIEIPGISILGRSAFSASSRLSTGVMLVVSFFSKGIDAHTCSGRNFQGIAQEKG
jgi:hypothetical protein